MILSSSKKHCAMASKGATRANS